MRCVSVGGCNRRHARDVPDKGGQFAGDGDDDGGGELAARGEVAVATAQAQVRDPGAVGDGLGQIVVAALDDTTD